MKDDKDKCVNLSNLSSILEHPVFPDWMSVEIEIESIYKLSVNNVQCLYHYTSLEGFQSIMQKRDFWISNIRYITIAMNLKMGRQYVRK